MDEAKCIVWLIIINSLIYQLIWPLIETFPWLVVKFKFLFYMYIQHIPIWNLVGMLMVCGRSEALDVASAWKVATEAHLILDKQAKSLSSWRASTSVRIVILSLATSFTFPFFPSLLISYVYNIYTHYSLGLSKGRETTSIHREKTRDSSFFLCFLLLYRPFCILLLCLFLIYVYLLSCFLHSNKKSRLWLAFNYRINIKSYL